MPKRSAFAFPPEWSPVILTGVVLAHAVLFVMLALTTGKTIISEPRPLMVRLIESQPEKQHEPASAELEPAKPVPVVQPSPQPNHMPKPAVMPPTVLAAETVAQKSEAPMQARTEPRPVPEMPLPPSPMQEPVRPVPVIEAVKPPPSTHFPPSPPRPAAYAVNPEPPYPRLSSRLGEEGTVMLSVQVNADGTVADVDVHKTSGFPRLDQAALETVRRDWKFEPARQEGKPVAGRVIVPIKFVLRS